MYVCGITPYDSTHLGHAATYLTYDLLIRRLEELGHEVRMVRNITDVDDSILPKARELGIPYLELAAAEVGALPRRHGRARDASAGRRAPRDRVRSRRIIDLVGRLLDSGHAYLSGGSVYFDVSTLSRLRQALALPRGPHGEAGREHAAATPTIRTAGPRSTSCCGSRRCADEPAWRCAVRCGPARLAHRVLGDGHARARRDASTCTAAAPTWCSRTTSARSRRASRSPVSRSPGTGCTRRW